MSDDTNRDVTDLTVQLLSAYLANNSVPSGELAGLIATTREALSAPTTPAAVEAPVYTPAVSVKKSLASPDEIVSLIDGKGYKTLKRHLAKNGLTPAEYRERYNLRSDYPMVAPAYSDHRRTVAQNLGLGRKSNARTETPPPAKPEAAATIQPVAKADATLAKKAAAPAKAKPVKASAPAKAAPQAATTAAPATKPKAPAKAKATPAAKPAASAPKAATAPKTAKPAVKAKPAGDQPAKPAAAKKPTKSKAPAAAKTPEDKAPITEIVSPHAA